MGDLDKISSSPKLPLSRKVLQMLQFRALHSTGWSDGEKLGDVAPSYRDFHPL